MTPQPVNCFLGERLTVTVTSEEDLTGGTFEVRVGVLGDGVTLNPDEDPSDCLVRKTGGEITAAGGTATTQFSAADLATIGLTESRVFYKFWLLSGAGPAVLAQGPFRVR